MQLIAHVERYHDEFLIGFGSFACFQNGFYVDDNQHYCGFRVSKDKLRTMFDVVDVEKIVDLKKDEQLALKLKFSVLALEDLASLCEQKQVLNCVKDLE